ncbi:MAG: adenosylhomocysteinase, partial [Omnitrophica WOR_2 bacterium GWA2_47_8]
DKGTHYEVKDMKLAEQGMLNLEIAESRMGALMKVKQRFAKEKPLKGIKIALALHVTKETGVLVRTLIAGGAEVAITGCNPLSTQDDVSAALAKEGVKVWAYKGETKEDYYRYLKNVIAFKPNITIDDGCDLVTEIHKNDPSQIKNIIGGCEETTTGVVRLLAMQKDGALKYPMIAVNNNKTKHLLDNFYGTGQSTLDGILRATNILFAGKNVVVCGYGSCGKGVALRAQGFGSNVIVTEVDAFSALQAVLDGYRVLPMVQAAKEGDIFITVTGNKNVIDLAHMKLMKSGSVLANAGHFDAEINLAALSKVAKIRKVRPFLDEYMLNGRKLYVCGEGRLVNLAAAEGHP